MPELNRFQAFRRRLIPINIARMGPRPIVFAGLPGVGKTTLSLELARQIGAVYVRIDSIEQALRETGLITGSWEDFGYRIAYAVAGDNGRSVVADSVNPFSSLAALGLQLHLRPVLPRSMWRLGVQTR